MEKAKRILILTSALLSSDEKIVELLGEILMREKEIDERILKIQSACDHTFSEENRTPPVTFFGTGNLLSKDCKMCGMHFEKPEDSSWKVCDKCWGKMEYLGQGLVGEDRTSFYKCKTCEHKHSDT